MRLFVFAIGGTGSRVLTSLIMQFAAGMRPKDENGDPIKNFSLVPIIVDPHEGNAGLQQVKDLLNRYRDIRKRIYGANANGANQSGDSVAHGYFGVKIETLKEVEPQGGVSSDSFFFRMQRVSDNCFKDFIGLNSMDIENKFFAQMLFSASTDGKKGELDTEMREGFYGSPNIGCVALNEFRQSPDFATFRKAYHSGDRIFFIGSIFGGTGASGLPLFISSIRDLGNDRNDDEYNNSCSDAPIGALIVMPYFSITRDDKSEINDNEFVVKTRSALRYYDTNLNQYINNIYYIADPKGTAGFTNDPGKGGQNGNKAHVVEFAGALAMMDFLAETDSGVRKDKSGRKVVNTSTTKSYGLETDTDHIHFKGLSKQSDQLVLYPIMSFYLLRQFMQNYMKDMLDKPFAKDHAPKLDKSIFDNRDIIAFFKMFDEWANQMNDHGSQAHNLDLFSPVSDRNYAHAFHDEPGPKKGKLFGKKELKPDDIRRALDKAAEDESHYDNMSSDSRWYTIAYRAMEKVIEDIFDTDNLTK